MKERPILFSAPMVQAILEGRKTQTRRIIQQKHLEWVNNSVDNFLSGKWDQRPMPYGKPGDRLWVRETWFHQEGGPVYDAAGGVIDAFDDEIIYRADRPNRKTVKWKPSIFMPRWASRILLEVTDIRVERLQDISDEDSLAEGIYPTATGLYPGSPRAEYRKLWGSINGKGSWDENPWVWVIGFKRALS